MHFGYHKMSKCLLADSPPFSEAVTPLPSAGTTQSCRAQQEGLYTTSSSSSSPFLLIQGQKSRRNLVSIILHLLKPWGPTGNLQLLKLLIFFPTNTIKTQSKVIKHFSKTQSKCALSLEDGKQTSRSHRLDFTNQFGLTLLVLKRNRRISIRVWMCACIHRWDETEPLGSEPSPAVLFLNWMFSSEPQQVPPSLLQQQHNIFQEEKKVTEHSVSTMLLALLR